MKQSLTIGRETSNSFITYMLIFLAAMNFQNKFNFIVIITFCFYVLFSKSINFLLNSTFVALVLLAISWIITSPEAFSSILSPLRPITFLLFYMLGYMMCAKSNNSIDTFFRLILVSAMGSFFHFMLNYVLNIDSQMRISYDYWTNSVLSATGQASIACIALGLSIATLFSKTKLLYKITAVVVLFIIVRFNLILAGRTIFALIGVLTIVVFLYGFKSKHKTRKIIGLFILIAGVYLLFETNTFGIKSLFENSSFYDRFFGSYGSNLTSDTRLIKKMNYLSHFFDYPFGGIHFRNQYGYAHDIFLDTYDECGIVAFLSLIIIAVASVGNLWKILSNYGLPEIIRNGALCVFLVCYLQFMVEPILQGMPWLFALFCLINGALTYICNLEEKR